MSKLSINNEILLLKAKLNSEGLAVKLSEDYKKDNFKILYSVNKTGKCVIFCSGNGIYSEDTKEAYCEFIKKDRYEWENIAKHNQIQKHFEKIIFIRDIYRLWYIGGINEKYNSVDSVAGFLKTETNGYEVYCVGNSSGGYAAVLFGCLLHAKRVISVCGQFCFYIEHFKNYHDYIYGGEEIEQISKYYDLCPLIMNNKQTKILYFCPVGCNHDKQQLDYINNNAKGGILTFRFDAKIHGLGEIDAVNYPYLLICEDKDIERLSKKYSDKIIDPFTFYGSLLLFFRRYFLRLAKRIILKILKNPAKKEK
jgi:hypothetical protein